MNIVCTVTDGGQVTMLTNKNKACEHLAPIVTYKGTTKVVNYLVKHLKPYTVQFDAIAFRGLSGALIAPIVAQRLGKNIIGVRKKEEKRHSSHTVEGVVCNKYIIIDDFVDEGYTITAIYSEIASWSHHQSQLVGIALYDDDMSRNDNRELKEFLKDKPEIFVINRKS